VRVTSADRVTIRHWWMPHGMINSNGMQRHRINRQKYR